MSTRQGREVAYRLFATEYDDADLEYAESDEERAPNYVVTPTGARANRAFVAGVLTEITPVGDEEVLRARIADPTGAFVLYAGQYQPEALAVIEEAEAPAFLAVTGKARTFQPEDGDRTFTSLRPETITHVDSDVRDHHVVTAAERTIERVDTFALALQSGLTGDGLRGALETAGLDAARADGLALALEHYDTSPAYLAALRDRAIQALEVVAGEREEVDPLGLAPDASPGEEQPRDLSTTFAAVDGSLEAPEDAGVPAEETAPETDDAAETAQTATTSTTEAETEPATDDGTARASETATAAVGGADGESSVEDGVQEPAPDDSAADDVSEQSTGNDTSAGGTTEQSPADDAPTGDGPPESDGEDASPSDEIDEPAEATSGDPKESADDAGFELDEDQREEIESEFPTDFETGNDVEEAGAADIDVPDPEEVAEIAEGAEGAGDDQTQTGAETDATPDSTGVTDAGDETGESDADGGEDSTTEDDLEELAIEHMESLDEGNGVERSALIAAVVDETGADPEAVDDAIDEALMDGRCYAPGDDTLKPI